MEDKREKILALSLAKECYSIKLDLLMNSIVVDGVIRFVSSSNNSKGKPKSSSNNSGSDEDTRESMEPDYNEDEKSDKEGEEKQEKETREIAIITTANQVF
jgi:hypothetical protein